MYKRCLSANAACAFCWCLFWPMPYLFHFHFRFIPNILWRWCRWKNVKIKWNVKWFHPSNFQPTRIAQSGWWVNRVNSMNKRTIFSLTELTLLIHISASEIFEGHKKCERLWNPTFLSNCWLNWVERCQEIFIMPSVMMPSSTSSSSKICAMRLNVFRKYVTHFPFDLPFNRDLINMKSVCLCVCDGAWLYDFYSIFQIA